MERLSDRAIEILNELHTERLSYNSEYLPLIEAAHKLAEYEATGLEPSEIQWRKEDLHILDLFKEQVQDADEAILIAEARRDGRLVVQPCKQGDCIWRAAFGEVREYHVLSVNSQNYINLRTLVECFPFLRFYWEDDFRRTIFLTREEAEAALKQKQDTEAVK